MAQQKTTFGGVDILRFLAAVLVMFYHYGFWVWAFPGGISARATGGVPPPPDLAFVGSGWVGVQVFFGLSCFVRGLSARRRAPRCFFECWLRRVGVWRCVCFAH